MKTKIQTTHPFWAAIDSMVGENRNRPLTPKHLIVCRTMLFLSSILIFFGCLMLIFDVPTLTERYGPLWANLHILFRISIIAGVIILFVKAANKETVAKDFNTFLILAAVYSMEGTLFNPNYYFGYVQAIGGVAFFSTMPSGQLRLVLPLTAVLYLTLIVVCRNAGIMEDVIARDTSIAVVIAAMGGIIAAMFRDYWRQVNQALVDKQLESNARLIDLGRHLGILCHDMAGLLGVLKMTTALLEDNQEKSEEVNDSVKRLSRTTDHLIKLQSFILSMSRNEPEKSQIIPGAEMCETMRSLVLGMYVRATPHLEFHFDENATYKCCPAAVTFILANAVSNSLHHLDSGYFKDKDHELRIQVFVAIDAVNQDMLMRIRDNGPGFPQHFLGSLFKESVSTKAHQGGSGLGLRNMARYAEFQGGSITAYNEFGAVVEVRIPQ